MLALFGWWGVKNESRINNSDRNIPIVIKAVVNLKILIIDSSLTEFIHSNL